MKQPRSKSGRQKRDELDEKRAAKLARVKKKAREDQAETELRFAVKVPATAETAPVNRDKLKPDNSYGVPGFVERGFYRDATFVCRDCGAKEVWRATQQKWWYEVAKGGVWTTAIRCGPCRRKEKARRDEARRVHLEGLARKKAKRGEKG